MKGVRGAALFVALALLAPAPARASGCVRGRQTEDPLSPRCAAPWRGDNGGSTARGVTRSEVRVIYYNDRGIRGDMNANPVGPPATIAAIKRVIEYLQGRFETYGRTVRVLAYPSGGTTARSRRKDAIIARTRFDPFAAVADVASDGEAFLVKLAEFGVPSFTMNGDPPESLLLDLAPFLWSFFPDQETEADLSAWFVCQKLVARRARHAGDLDLSVRTRKLGLIYPVDSPRGGTLERLALLLRERIQRRCGYRIPQVAQYSGGPGAGASEAPAIMARFKLLGVTTVICYCIPVPNEVTVTTMQSAASAIEYHPEWYWDRASRMDLPVWQHAFGNREQPSFGSSVRWLPLPEGLQHYEEASGERGGWQTGDGFRYYHLFLQLFTAVQTAGPALTVSSARRGLFGHRSMNLRDPYTPAGGYGPRGAGPYSFIHSSFAWWWDSTGPECMRAVRGGVRATRGGWPAGDADLFRTSDACIREPDSTPRSPKV